MNFFKDKKRHITFFIFTSLLLHFLLFFLLREGLEILNASKIPEPPPVWVELKKMELPLQIADIPEPQVEEIPDQASAQALYNQKVPEETVNPLPPARPQKGEGEESVAQEKTEKPKEPPPKTTEPQPKKEIKTVEELYAMRPPEKFEEKFKPPSRPRMPGLPEEEASVGSSSADDYFPNYKVGGKTYLNTLANPNIRYFVELKRKFKLTFNPVPSLRGRINEISRGQIDVVLGVSINQNGELADLIIIRSSGIEAYDREGFRTVRSSAPFSAPPTNILESDGMLHMAWTFIVYL